jgi:hypothetical protein
MIAGRTLSAHLIQFFCLFACLMIAGCSGGPPSGDDIKAALEDGAKANLKDLAPIIGNVTDVGCNTAQGKPGFICSFKVAFFSKLTNTQTSKAMEARFVQQDSKWMLIDDKG